MIEDNEKISGWYYDKQLENEYMSVSLHSNKIYVKKPLEEGNENSHWKDVPKEQGDGEPYIEYNDTKNGGDSVAGSYSTDGSHCYNKIPICSSILAEDFQVSVANQWTQAGGDILSSAFSAMKTYAPYSNFITQELQELKSNAAAEMERMKSAGEIGENGELVQGHKMAGALNKVMSNIPSALIGAADNITGYLNRRLIVQGTQFSYYDGSGIAFGNLGMRFTVFPKVDSKSGKIITVTEQIEDLYPYVIGPYVPMDEKVLDADLLKDVPENVKKTVRRYVGWQLPPGGYKANVLNIDAVQEGTLKLRIGTLYSISNLVCSDISLNFSKQLVKLTLDKTNIVTSPLFCEVVLNLTPVSKFSDVSLRKFVSGNCNPYASDRDNKLNATLAKMNSGEASIHKPY